MKIIRLLFCITIALLSCKKNNKPLNEFNTIISKSDRIVVRFDENKYYNEAAVVKVITKSSHISQLKDLIKQSGDGKNCKYYNGTMTFFSNSPKNGFLEFSTNANCPSLYLHLSNGIFEYNMSPYCGIFLQSIRYIE
jgi:hypothetical protein